MTQPQTGIGASLQALVNSSFDPDLGIIVVGMMGYDGVSAQLQLADAVAMKITEDGDITYIAVAAPGTAQATAAWQVKKLDQSSGTVITWADGNASFDNVATDLTALSYS